MARDAMYPTPIYPHLIVYTDGGTSRGNPGHGYCAAIAATPDGTVVLASATHLGSPTTNNEAEYYGVLSAIKLIGELAPESVTIRCDSKLIVNQLTGKYKPETHRLWFLKLVTLMNMMTRFSTSNIEWIPRAENPADYLCVMLRRGKTEEEARAAVPIGSHIGDYLKGKKGARRD